MGLADRQFKTNIQKPFYILLCLNFNRNKVYLQTRHDEKGFGLNVQRYFTLPFTDNCPYS
jgi:hypothetical protein